MDTPKKIPTDPPSRGLGKVLLLENIHSGARDRFATEGFEVELHTAAMKEDELIEALRGVQILGIRSKTHITKRVIDASKDLLAVGCFCIGTNQVELVHANRHGVPVFNAPFSNTRSVAEMIIGEIILLARQLGDRSREVHTGVWKKVANNCFEVRGKTLGIIGYGHIGQQLGVLAEALGMRVIFHDIVPKLPMGNARPTDTLEALLRDADFVSLHVPETPETKNLIGESEIAAMRKGSYLLNASRGTVVVIPALVAGLKRHHLAGAAVDVYPEEPESNTKEFVSELQNLPNVLLTPHIGGSTEQAQEAIGREVSHTLIKFATTGASTGAVNFPQVEIPPIKDTHRVLNVHRNQPGVLSRVNKIVSDLEANIDAQFLTTDPNIGYLIMDIHHDVSYEVARQIQSLDFSIRTRVLY
ncbi:MAG: phosphoglycerate dehydrogenase [Polyangiaceae bacterium]